MTATAAVSQHMTALARANEIRMARATLKRDLYALPKEQSRNLAAVILLDPPWEAETMRISDLLKATRSLGPSKARMILKATGVSEFRKLCDLTERERGVLARAVSA